jgi:hypothetical protein
MRFSMSFRTIAKQHPDMPLFEQPKLRHAHELVLLPFHSNAQPPLRSQIPWDLEQIS